MFFEGVSVLSKLFAVAGVSILDGPIWHHNYYFGSVLGFCGSVWYIIKKKGTCKIFYVSEKASTSTAPALVYH